MHLLDRRSLRSAEGTFWHMRMTTLVIENINQPPLSDSVSRKLTELVVVGALKPGQQLPSEAALASQFGVSKPVIREALRMLAARGIVEIRHGKVATVCSPTAEPLRTFFEFAVGNTQKGLMEAVELRRVLETAIAQLAAERITDAEVSRLQGIVATMRDSLETLDPWADADLDFHIQIAECAQNNLMLFLVKGLSSVFRESMLRVHCRRRPDERYATLLHHVKILEGLQARDPEGAKQAMNVHFDASESAILGLMADAKP